MKTYDNGKFGLDTPSNPHISDAPCKAIKVVGYNFISGPRLLGVNYIFLKKLPEYGLMQTFPE